MKSFADLDTLVGSVPFSIVSDLRIVDTGRGSEALYRDKLPELLTSLADRARVASIEASSAIEGVVVPDKARRASILAGRNDHLRDRSEQEFAGYRSALDYLYQERWGPLNAGLLLHLHRLLFQYTRTSGGQFKDTENRVVDVLPDGTRVDRFVPVSARLTPAYIEELIALYTSAQVAGRHHPIILSGLFVLDLLTIHPFTDGNGRIARALTNALLQEAGYDVTRYVSLEAAIANSADAYYASLQQSTFGWHEGEHNPWPWLRYFVRIVAESYERFSALADENRSDGTKQDRVRDYVLNHAPRTFQITDVRVAFPGVSDQTIRLALSQLRVAGHVDKVSSGRSATWVRLDVSSAGKPVS